MNKKTFNKEVYYKKIIFHAINDYRDIASITLEEQNQYFICTFLDCKYDRIETINEFANYLIELSNSRGI